MKQGENRAKEMAREIAREVEGESLCVRIEALRMRLADDQAASRQLLQRAGILDKKGNLAKAYR